jgi:serine/threonine protein phosphatase PrpC
MSFAVSELMRDFKDGNHVTGVNVGDSRVKLGKEKNGRMVAHDNITFDHKPDYQTQPAAEGRRKSPCGSSSNKLLIIVLFIYSLL